MRFERYHLLPILADNLSDLGYLRPTDIQYRAIPPILQGTDILAIAQTGTGKTMAFAIPILEILGRYPRKRPPFYPRAIVMVPTHELAEQVEKVFASLSMGMRITSRPIVGGIPFAQQVSRLPKSIDILVATPGRMNDLARNRIVDLSEVQILVLDEADRMLSLGFQPDIQHILQHLPRRRQTLFFSATISPKIKKLAYKLVTNPIRIEIAPEDPISRNVHHSLLEVTMDEKRFFLERLLREHSHEKVMVFTRTQVRAERVQRAMARVGIESEVIHGGLDRAQRLQALQTFSESQVKVLIATDVSARGLDIPDVAFVVNYDMPTEPEVYVHRIGRTGRGTNRGTAVSFCAPEEDRLRRAIEDMLGRYLPVIDIDEVEHEETVDYSVAAESDWRTLIKRNEEELIEQAARQRKQKFRKR